MAASILTPLDNPITKEDLIKLGFKTKLNKADIDVRYDLANMSDDSIIKMVKENIYYEKIISDYYRIVVIYYPSTYYDVHYTGDFGSLLRNDNFKYEKKPYNLEITSRGTGYGIRYNPGADHKRFNRLHYIS